MQLPFGKLGQDTATNIFGTGINGLLGLAFYVIAARFLGDSDFGLFTVAVGFLILVTDIFDFGTNQGILKFIPKAVVGKDEQEQKETLKIAFVYKVIIGLLITVLGIFLARPIAEIVFKNAQLSDILLIALLGSLGIFLLTFIVSILQAYQKFLQSIAVNIVSNVVRLALVILLLLVAAKSATSVTAVFILAPFVAMVIGWKFLPINFLSTRVDLANAKTFFTFNKWVALGFIFAAIQANLGSFMLLRLNDAAQAGIFAASTKLMSFFPQVVGALSITFAPKFAENIDTSTAKSFLKKTAIISTLAAIGILIILPFAENIIKIIYGEGFSGAIPVLQISTLQTSFLFLSIPATTAILYLWGKSQIYALVAILQTLVVFGLNIILIPNIGAVGASVSFLVATVLVFVVATAYAVVKLK